ncbi:MAG: BMP family ABC transporter substrate-binding protein [Candidatus Heimdallarchaeota archaeon]|nr:BMP family ABC transporter substrate-binding protein [Candidatus Heimdallarchaeota archaeon]
MKRSIFTLLFITLLAMGMSSAVRTAQANTQGYDAVVAVVFSTGGLGDQSFNDAANAGLLQARIQHNISVTTVEPKDVPAINTQLLNFGADSENDLVIAIGFSSAGGLNATALANPGTDFTLIDSVVPLPNVANIVFKEQEGSFLAGAMAALTTESNKLGFLGGLDIPLINRFGSGFEQGAKWINPAITVTWAYSPDAANPWGDLAGGKTVAQSMIDTGVDIIFSAAGGTGLGVFDAAQEATDAGSKTYAIGVDSNQDHLKKGTVLTSMLKRVDVAVKSQIDAKVDGTWDNGTQVLGLEEGGVSITEMEHTQAEANAVCGTTTRLAYVNSLSPGIIDGSIYINESRIVVDAEFNSVAHPCGAAPTTTSEEPTTVTSVITSVSVSEEGGVPISIIPITFSLFATVFILRKRK